MKIIQGQSQGENPMRLYRNNQQTYAIRGGSLVVAKWPRKRGSKGTPAQLEARAQFTQSAVWFKTAMEQDWIEATNLSPGTAFMPRDIYEMAVFGKLLVAQLKDGRTLWGKRMASVDVQAFLDQITQTIGAMLVRSGDGWIGIDPGSAGQVLTTNGTGTIPNWQAASSGGGGQSYEAAWTKPLASDFTLNRFDTGGSLITTTKGIAISAPLTSGNVNECNRAGQAIPASGPTGWRITARLYLNCALENYIGSGLYLRNSSTSKIQFIGLCSNPPSIGVEWYNNDTTFGGGHLQYPGPATDVWCRIEFDGTHYNWLHSMDGENWTRDYQELASSSQVAGADECGFQINPNGNSSDSSMYGQLITLGCVSWNATGY